MTKTYVFSCYLSNRLMENANLNMNANSGVDPNAQVVLPDRGHQPTEVCLRWLDMCLWGMYMWDTLPLDNLVFHLDRPQKGSFT